MNSRLVLTVLAVLISTGPARAGDKEDIAAVIEQYRIHEEAGDMIAQGRLMTDDRAMMYVGGRLTGDNREVMREQQEYMKEFQAKYPGVRYQIEIRNMQIQTWNDTALATFEWFPARIVPPGLSADKVRELGPAKTPLIFAHVMVKQAGAWKIAFTSFVPPEKCETPDT